jgi:hypothetical protein
LDESFAQLQVDIKAMKLYQRPELLMQLYNNLRAIGKSSGDLSFRDLLPYDQHHYEGIEAVDEAAKLCRIGPGSSVINVGSGLAGPARYLAGTYGCDVLAIELQEDLHGAAAELTGRCESSIKDLVTHLGGNVLKLAPHLQHGRYDAIVSWLTVLHFDRPARASLFKHVRLRICCHAALCISVSSSFPLFRIATCARLIDCIAIHQHIESCIVTCRWMFLCG